MSKTSSLFLVFLICFNLYSNLAMEASSAKKKELISLLSARTEYVIDDVLTLLEGLLQTAQDELATLQEEWPAIEAEKQGTVDLYTGLVTEQTNLCSELTGENTDLAEEIEDTQAQIATDSARIVENNDRVNALLDDRCTANRNYITGLKRSKQALEIIQILRDAVDSFNPSLLEKKHLRTVAKRFINFLQFASKAHVTGLAQILQDVETSNVTERTSEEIGTGHVDNTEEEITVADFDSQTIEDLQSVKTRLVTLLDELEADINTEITQNEANEATANEELSDYQVNIETENNYLTTEIATLTEELATLQSDRQASEEAVSECEASLTGLQSSLENAEEDYASATTNYNDNNQRLQEEVALFQEVYTLYETEVASASEQLKEEVDTVEGVVNADDEEEEETVLVQEKHTAKKNNVKKTNEKKTQKITRHH